MTVTMTIEEFDELREAQRELQEIENFLYRTVHFYAEAYDAMADNIVQNAIEYVKPLDQKSLIELLKITGLRIRFKNIDFTEAEE